MPSPLPLLSKFDNNIELLLSKFQELVELSLVKDKEYEVQSVEALQIESDGWTIIKIAEELLSVTRTLKESWVLGQTGTGNLGKDLSDKQALDLYNKINKLLDHVAD